jgi:hypothetical protein
MMQFSVIFFFRVILHHQTKKINSFLKSFTIINVSIYFEGLLSITHTWPLKYLRNLFARNGSNLLKKQLSRW